MKRKTETNKQSPSEKYYSPAAETLMVDVTHILCNSESQSMLNSTEMKEGDNNW